MSTFGATTVWNSGPGALSALANWFTGARRVAGSGLRTLVDACSVARARTSG